MKCKLKFITDSDFGVTYKLNKINGVFNWYPYTEGFSKPFVDRMLKHFKATKKNLILDPFSGCGTTALSCTIENIPAISIEVNPFMNFVGKTKNNSLNLNKNKIKLLHNKIKRQLEKKNLKIRVPSFLNNKPFFNPENLNQAIYIKEAIKKCVLDKEYMNFFLLHLASILTKISNMVRAVDLRYRKNKPLKLDVLKMYVEKIEKAIDDLSQFEQENIPKQIFLNEDICNMNYHTNKYLGKIDYVITSPPYLNGTNYDRNTKLEMGFLDMIKTDEDLKKLRIKMITAGIGSTHSENKSIFDLKFIDSLISDVEKNAYDRRIPIMVRGYFQDMSLAMYNITRLMKKNAKGVIVIGDSQFGGVHIETDIILAKICEIVGLKVESIEVVRERRSRNGMKLRESLIFVRK